MSNSFDANKLAKSSRRTAVITFLALVIIAMALIYSFNQLSELQDNIKRSKNELDSLKSEANAQMILIKQREDSINTLDLKIKLLNQTIYEAATVSSKSIRDAVKKIAMSDSASAQYLPHIYIHIRNNSQRKPARIIARILQKAGFLVVPDFEKVNQGPNQTEVRYFRITNLKEKKEAEYIAKILNDNGLKNVVAYPISGYEKSVPLRQYEIWFSPQSFNSE